MNPGFYCEGQRIATYDIPMISNHEHWSKGLINHYVLVTLKRTVA
jgi:hypothetical protein